MEIPVRKSTATNFRHAFASEDEMNFATLSKS